jgi:hypothetical protein
MRNGNGSKSTSEKLQELAERKAAIDARIQKIEAQLAAKARKEDTRLKVLVGAAFLADLEKHPELRKYINRTLNRAIVSEKDRKFLADKNWLHGEGDANGATTS